MLEAHLEGQAVHPIVLAGTAHGNRPTGLHPADSPQALDQHEHADDAEKRNVAQRDDEIDLAKLA